MMPSHPRTAAEVMPLVRLALPIVAGLAASTLIGVVDTLMIAPLGTVPLAGAALATSIIIIFYATLYGFLSAVGVEAAHRYGAGDAAGVSAALRAGLTLALCTGSAGAAIMGAVFFALPLLGQPPEVLAILGPYWAAMSALLIPATMIMAIAQVLNAVDRPWTAAGFAFVGVILNVPLNFVLIWGIGDWPGLGLLGAGLASLGAESVACLLALAWLSATGRLRRGTARPGLLPRLARDGVPLGIGYMGEGAAFALVGVLLGLFGAAALASNQIVQAVGGVLYMLPLGMAAAVTIRIGQAIGGGEEARLRPIARAALGVVTGWMVFVTVALILLGGTVADALSDDPAVVQLATAMFVVVALIQVADGIQSTAYGALRGMTDYRVPTAITLCTYWLFALPLAGTLGFAADLGPLGVWGGYGLGIVIAAILLPLRFWHLTRARLSAA
jgi:MATE family multidrug resistance protein